MKEEIIIKACTTICLNESPKKSIQTQKSDKVPLVTKKARIGKLTLEEIRTQNSKKNICPASPSKSLAALFKNETEFTTRFPYCSPPRALVRKDILNQIRLSKTKRNLFDVKNNPTDLCCSEDPRKLLATTQEQEASLICNEDPATFRL